MHPPVGPLPHLSLSPPPSRLVMTATPTLPPVTSYRCKLAVPLSGKALATLPYLGKAFAASARDSLAPSEVTSPGRGPCHVPLSQHYPRRIGRLLPTHPDGVSIGRGPCHTSPSSQCPRCLRSPPTGAFSVGTFPRWGLPCLPITAASTPPPVVLYRHLPSPIRGPCLRTSPPAPPSRGISRK